MRKTMNMSQSKGTFEAYNDLKAFADMDWYVNKLINDSLNSGLDLDITDHLSNHVAHFGNEGDFRQWLFDQYPDYKTHLA